MDTKEKRMGRDLTSTRDPARVLIISDDSTQAYVDALEGVGLEIVGVSSGAAALVSLQRSRPHLVVAALTRKGLSQVELARTLGQIHDNLPLVLAGTEQATLERRCAAL